MDREKRSSSHFLVDLHVAVVPTGYWIEKLNYASQKVLDETISAGFVRVHPDKNVLSLREDISKQIGSSFFSSPYVFLRHVGRCLAMVHANQESFLKARDFLPPRSELPEIFVLPYRPAGYRRLSATSTESETKIFKTEGQQHLMPMEFSEGQSRHVSSDALPPKSATQRKPTGKSASRQEERKFSPVKKRQKASEDSKTRTRHFIKNGDGFAENVDPQESEQNRLSFRKRSETIASRNGHDERDRLPSGESAGKLDNHRNKYEYQRKMPPFKNKVDPGILSNKTSPTEGIVTPKDMRHLKFARKISPGRSNSDTEDFRDNPLKQHEGHSRSQQHSANEAAQRQRLSVGGDGGEVIKDVYSDVKRQSSNIDSRQIDVHNGVFRGDSVSREESYGQTGLPEKRRWAKHIASSGSQSASTEQNSERGSRSPHDDLASRNTERESTHGGVNINNTSSHKTTPAREHQTESLGNREDYEKPVRDYGSGQQSRVSQDPDGPDNDPHTFTIGNVPLHSDGTHIIQARREDDRDPDDKSLKTDHTHKDAEAAFISTTSPVYEGNSSANESNMNTRSIKGRNIPGPSSSELNSPSDFHEDCSNLPEGHGENFTDSRKQTSSPTQHGTLVYDQNNNDFGYGQGLPIPHRSTEVISNASSSVWLTPEVTDVPNENFLTNNNEEFSPKRNGSGLNSNWEKERKDQGSRRSAQSAVANSRPKNSNSLNRNDDFSHDVTQDLASRKRQSTELVNGSYGSQASMSHRDNLRHSSDRSPVVLENSHSTANPSTYDDDESEINSPMGDLPGMRRLKHAGVTSNNAHHNNENVTMPRKLVLASASQGDSNSMSHNLHPTDGNLDMYGDSGSVELPSRGTPDGTMIMHRESKMYETREEFLVETTSRKVSQVGFHRHSEGEFEEYSGYNHRRQSISPSRSRASLKSTPNGFKYPRHVFENRNRDDSDELDHAANSRKKELLEELERARDERAYFEELRQGVMKKAKEIASQITRKRGGAKDVWKRRYFDEKKKTASLEEIHGKLRNHGDSVETNPEEKLPSYSSKSKKATLSYRHERPSFQNNTKIEARRSLLSIADLKKRLAEAKAKLAAEMKMRHEAENEMKSMRQGLLTKKIQSHLAYRRMNHLRELNKTSRTLRMTNNVLPYSEYRR